MKVYPGSLSYDIWKEIPIPMYMSVYYWNVTNYHDIEARVPGVKPILEEVGPYVFKEEHFKVGVHAVELATARFSYYCTAPLSLQVNETWDNSTVTYYQIKQWHFEESMSAGSMEDEVVSINMIAVVRNVGDDLIRVDGGQIEQFFFQISVRRRIRPLPRRLLHHRAERPDQPG